MDYKKIKTDNSTVTRNINEFTKDTDNSYKTACILAIRSNQINQEIKKELTQKLDEFALSTDNLEEVFENRECELLLAWLSSFSIGWKTCRDMSKCSPNPPHL